MRIRALPVSSGPMQCNLSHKPVPIIRAAAITSSITSRLSRQRFPQRIVRAFYGSFTRDVCDKYLTVFADFKYVRSFFDASLSAVPFIPDPFEALV